MTAIPQMVALSEVAERLGVDRKTLIKWAKDPAHPFPAYQYGRRWFANEAEVNEWLDSRQARHQDRAHGYRSQVASEELHAP